MVRLQIECVHCNGQKSATLSINVDVDMNIDRYMSVIYPVKSLDFIISYMYIKSYVIENMQASTFIDNPVHVIYMTIGDI